MTHQYWQIDFTAASKLSRGAFFWVYETGRRRHVWALCHRAPYASAALKAGLMLVRKVSSVRGTRYFELALRLPMWPRAGFRVARDRCWNAVTVTEGPIRSPHYESQPKLHFISLLSLQRLSHHSINTRRPPPNLFSSFFFFLLYTWKCSGTVPAFWCGSLFCSLAQETAQSWLFLNIKTFSDEHKGSEVF